jgi:hypothetical protein
MRSKKRNRVLAALLLIAAVLILAETSVLAQVVIQRCDVTTGWTGNETISIDVSDKKEGKASILTEAQTGDVTWFSKSFSYTQTGVDPTGYLIFWLYVSDASKLEGGQIDISSAGGPDTEASSWTLDKSSVVDGWNQMQLQLNQSTEMGGGANLDSINYFGISQNLSGPVTAKIDFIRFAPGVTEPSWPDLEVDEVDNASLDGKVMFGYQGWFNHPDDGADLGWVHWGNFYEPINSTVDMYPDMREYGLNEKYDADLTFTDGRMAPVFSSHNRSTVVRHMKWIRDYNLDGVFLQRFISSADSKPKMNHKDTVTRHVMEGCETYGRVFAIMYDGIANRVEDIKADWMHLVDDMAVTGSDRYLNHRGLPLVALWGYTVREEATVDQLVELINWFKNNPDPKYRASLLLGVAWDWYDESSAWKDAFRDVEVISPWFSGNTDYDRGQAWCDENNVDFLPVVHPGFSWHNLYGDTKNATPREGGKFFWSEVTEVVSKNAKSVYIAMFDEVDEGTAMFKLAENDDMIPREGYWLPLDEDGYDLPSDWYLRAAGLATEVVRGYEDNHATLITPPEGIMSIRIINEVNGDGQGGMEFIFPDFPDESSIEISIDSGASYTYSTPDDAGSYTISGLAEGDFQVFVRHGDGASEVYMGEVFIGNSIEVAPTAASEPYPADQESEVRTDVTLGWKEGEHVQSYTVYLGTNNPPDSVANQASATYKADELETNTTYYWKVDAVNAFGRAQGPVWSFTTGSGSASDFVVLDYCDSDAGWSSSNGINIDTEEKQEGYASLISQGGGTDWFKKQFSTPVNSLCDSTSYLDLWLYVSDVSKFDGGGQLEITSAGRPDVDEYNWAIGDLNLVNGWNELHLQISSANVMGNPDLSAITYFRLYQFVSGDVETRIDFIRFSGLVYEELSAPTNLTATEGDGLVSLDWDDNAEESVTGYNLYRALVPGISYIKVNSEPISLSEYTDEEVNNGTKYYYKVTATDQSKNESESSNVVTATPSANTSVASLKDIAAHIYPNPVDEVLHVVVENGKQASIFDFTGRLLKSVSLESLETAIPVSDLFPGKYIVKIYTVDGSGVYKLIKK